MTTNRIIRPWTAPVNAVRWNGLLVDPSNVPRHSPGVYHLVCQVNGKSYIGESVDIAGRLSGYHNFERYNGGQKKLRNAIRKYGASSFYAIPVFYLKEVEKEVLQTLETSLIVEYNAIANGYNQIENYHRGAYGEAWSTFLKSAWTEDRRRAQSLLTTEHFKDPARSAKQSAAVLKYLRDHPEVAIAFGEFQRSLWSDDEYRRKMLTVRTSEDRAATMRETANRLWSDPVSRQRYLDIAADQDYQKRRGAAIAASYGAPGGKDKLVASRADPDYRANQSAKGKARFETEEAIQAARDAQAEVADAHSASLVAAWARRPRGWIKKIDGTECRQRFLDEDIPEGWVVGRIVPKDERLWVTNGIENRKVLRSESIPDGWWPGKIHRNKAKV